MRSRKPRRICGAMLDVAGAAALLGISVDSLRARVRRRAVPFRRFGGRVVFLRPDLEKWLDALPGVSVDALIQKMQEDS